MHQAKPWDEAEQLRVQLAGCLVAAEGGTSEAVVAKPGDYGWSLAYQKVLDLRRDLDGERRLRVSLERMVQLQMLEEPAPDEPSRTMTLRFGFAMGVLFSALVGTAAWLHVCEASWWALFPAGAALVVAFFGNGGALEGE